MGERSPLKEEFKVPIKIQVSKTPLIIKLEVPGGFPHQPPTIQVMARVLHKEIDPVTKFYIGQALKGWNEQSTLLQLIRTIHQQFDMVPPIPESMAPAIQPN
jgi:ubiquitin-protein ligase